MTIKLVFLAVSILLAGLLLGKIVTIPNPIVATLVSLILLFALPGYLLVDLLWPAGKLLWMEKLTYAFGLGIMLLLVPAALLLAWRANLPALVWIVLPLNLILGVSWLFIDRPRRAGAKRAAVSARSAIATVQAETILLFAALGALVASMLYLFAAAPIIDAANDLWNYLAYIQKYLTGGQLNPENTLYATADARMARIGWLVLLALLSRMSAVHPVELFALHLPPLLALLSVLSFYTLAQTLFQNRQMALFATLIQLVYLASTLTPNLGGGRPGMGLATLTRLSEDKFFAMFVLFPLAQALLWRYFRDGKRKNLFLFTLAAVSLPLTHPISFALLGLSVGSFILVYVLVRGWPSIPVSNRSEGGWWLKAWLSRAGQQLMAAKTAIGRLITLLVVVGLVALIPLEARWVLTSAGAQSFGDAAQTGRSLDILVGERHIILFEIGRYMASPTLLTRPMILLALLLTPLLLGSLRKDLPSQFLLANLVIPLIIIYNPWTAPWLGKLMSSHLIWRIGFMWPIALIIGYVGYQAIIRLRQRFSLHTGAGYRHILSAFLPVGMVCLLIVLMQAPIRQGIIYLQDQHRHFSLTDSERDLLDQLPTLTAVDSIILANPKFNQYIPAFAAGRQPVTFKNWVMNDKITNQLNRFYHTNLVNNFIIEFVQEYQVGYVALETNSLLAAQLARQPAHFSLLYQNDTFSLFEVADRQEMTPLVQANTFLAYGQLSPALASYEQALKLNNQDILAHFGQARTHQIQGNLNRAEAAFLRAISLDPTFVWPYIYLADVYHSQGYLQQAFGVYHQAWMHQPDHPAVRTVALRAQALVADQKSGQQFLAEIVAAYKIDIDHKPDDLQAYQALATAYQLLDQPEQTIAVYRQAITHWPAWAEAYHALGQAYEGEGQENKAIAAYQQSINFKPVQEQAYKRLANLYYRADQLTETIDIYQTASGDNPTRAWPHLELGKLYLEQAAGSRE